MIYYNLGERNCLKCNSALELCLEVEFGIPPDKAKIKYVCPHCLKVVEDVVANTRGNLTLVTDYFVVATTEWKRPN